MNQNKIKEYAKMHNVPLWKVAQAIGISEPTLTRWLRVPVSEDRFTKIMEAIERLSQEV